MRPCLCIVIAMLMVQAKALSATTGSDTLRECSFSIMAEKFRPLAMMAFRPLVSRDEPGMASASMHIAFLAYSFFWAVSHCPLRQRATSCLAMALVVMFFWLRIWISISRILPCLLTALCQERVTNPH